jgi:hypothetical protein
MQQRFMSALRTHDWVVYAKPPFGGPQQVLDYLGRYTHRVAISNNRLVSLEHDQVSFRYKDYAHGNHPKMMRLGPPSSSAASRCTFCPRPSCASVTTACSPIGPNG